MRESIGFRVESIGSAMESIGFRIESIGSTRESMGFRVESIGSTRESIGSRVESIGSAGHFWADYTDLLGFFDKTEFDPCPEPPTWMVFENNQDWSDRQTLPPFYNDGATRSH